jgi:hypothetical protein
MAPSGLSPFIVIVRSCQRFGKQIVKCTFSVAVAVVVLTASSICWLAIDIQAGKRSSGCSIVPVATMNEAPKGWIHIQNYWMLCHSESKPNHSYNLFLPRSEYDRSSVQLAFSAPLALPGAVRSRFEHSVIRVTCYATSPANR